MADANNNLPQPLHNAAGSLAPQRPTEFAGILRLLSTLSYQDREQISAYERQVYDMLRSSPQNLDGLVAFLRIQLMQGNHQKAKAVANRIWEIGGTLDHEAEKSYVNDLLNLGLVEMASILLRPYFEKMSAYVGEYGHLFLKYAIAAGLLNVIEKTAALLLSVGVRKALTDFAAVYRHLNYADAFKGIQRSVLDNVRDTLCAYEFNLYTDRGFTDLEILLYVGNETLDYERLREFVDLQASAVCSAKGVKRLNNLRFTLSLIFSPAAVNSFFISRKATSCSFSSLLNNTKRF